MPIHEGNGLIYNYRRYNYDLRHDPGTTDNTPHEEMMRGLDTDITAGEYANILRRRKLIKYNMDRWRWTDNRFLRIRYYRGDLP